MSLLIKALNKAEEKAQAQTAKTEQLQAEPEQALQSKPKATAVKKKSVDDSINSDAKESDLELSLSPTDSLLVDPVSVADTLPKEIDTSPALSSRSNQQKPIASGAYAKSAANVFSAKGMNPRNQNKSLAIIAGASLLVLLGIGLYYYQILNQPEVVIPPKPVLASTATESQQITPPLTAETSEVEMVEDSPEPLIEAESTEPEQAKSAVVLAAETKKPARKKLNDLSLTENEALETSINQNEVVEDAPQVMVSKTSEKPNRRLSREAIASDSATIEVTKSNSQASINPTLMSAYEAYNAGNDAEAQKLYKQVLQRDLRNVDALLGLGAIASRQGRIADANSWYGKVLEIEPRNSIAQSAMLDNEAQISSAQGYEQDTENRLKTMLTKQPDDANLHVALGNFYAERNQWSSAQQAYFDANRLNPSADNAFNLAVSLDHMGKPKLALPYYQRALALASSNSNIDKAALEARIAAIQ